MGGCEGGRVLRQIVNMVLVGCVDSCMTRLC